MNMQCGLIQELNKLKLGNHTIEKKIFVIQ